MCPLGLKMFSLELKMCPPSAPDLEHSYKSYVYLVKNKHWVYCTNSSSRLDLVGLIFLSLVVQL